MKIDPKAAPFIRLVRALGTASQYRLAEVLKVPTRAHNSRRKQERLARKAERQFAERGTVQVVAGRRKAVVPHV